MPLRWVVMLGMTCTRSEGWTVWMVSSWSFSKTSVGLFNPLILLPGVHIFLTWDFCVHCTSSALYGTQRPLLNAVPHIPHTQQTQQNIKLISSPKKHAAQKPKSLQESVEWCDLSSSEALLRGWHKGPTLSQVGLELGFPQVLGFGKWRWMMLVIFLEWGSVPIWVICQLTLELWRSWADWAHECWFEIHSLSLGFWVITISNRHTYLCNVQ